MNKAIEILAEGVWALPEGTKCTSHGKFKNKWVSMQSEHKAISSENKSMTSSENKSISGNYIEVDFSDLPPLYPCFGMVIPKEGIKFADGKGRLVDVGQYGITLIKSSGKTVFVSFKHINEFNEIFELKRILPKTVTVCAGCCQLVCECGHTKGWYRVKSGGDRWAFRYWDGVYFQTNNGGIGNYRKEIYEDIDWTLENVIPESER